MTKLQQLEKEEREASNAFMYAKANQPLAELYKAQEKARQALQKYRYNTK